MATRTITRLYDAYADAAQVVTDLETAGVPDSDISIVTNNRDDRHATDGNAGTGAATGGLIGSLTKSGVPEREANVYAEGVRRGGSLVTVRTDDARAFEVERIMDRRRSIDWMERDRTYRSEGWERFDPDAPAYTPPAGAGHGPVRTDRY